MMSPPSLALSRFPLFSAYIESTPSGVCSDRSPETLLKNMPQERYVSRGSDKVRTDQVTLNSELVNYCFIDQRTDHWDHVPAIVTLRRVQVFFLLKAFWAAATFGVRKIQALHDLVSSDRPSSVTVFPRGGLACGDHVRVFFESLLCGCWGIWSLQSFLVTDPQKCVALPEYQ